MNGIYKVDFYDGFDGWVGMERYTFNNYDEAVKCCQEKMKKLGKRSIDSREHYGVFEGTIEVYCGLNPKKKQGE